MIKLYSHQVVARKHLMQNNAFALFMDQGSGKTLPILFHLAYLFEHGLISNAIIIAPLSTLGSWSRDLDKLPKRRRESIGELEIINYDKVWRRAEIYEKKWDCIVLDESHSIKHRTSKRSKAVRKMARNGSKYRYILTGTPMSNGHLEEYWAQYDFLDNSIFNTYKKFSDRYCLLNQFFKPYKYRNTDELIEIINNHCYRITKEECLDLPDKLPDEVIKVELKEKKLYKQMMDNFIKELEIEASNPLVRTIKLRQIASGFIVNEEGQIHSLKSDKLKILGELLEARGDKKTVIFAEFKHSIKSIRHYLEKSNIKHLVLDGDQKDKNIWKKFQSDETEQVIVCQYQTANAGIDLFASDTIIFYEPTLSSTVNDQAKDRIHRIGQNSKCSYYYLLTKGTLETQIYNTVAKGSDFGKEVLLDFIRRGERP
ncbi:DEAD/DEAH box helicase [Erysipelothrix sp. HDW6A]|uniref:DEAD/DEAH box helicase n=1 Tax=Erysipelothrix sp. HDW6A TaxID=2714928 RepID=UPI00140B017E|nr:DEAD/DEAH box helicase [Erysipelothrix sp. HDW6A]QIK57796.1 DEAD/DEAH box helicase [Erysipelothrix sp. HDW6A]